MVVLRQLFLMIALFPLSLAAQEEVAEFTSDLFGGLTSTTVLPVGRLQLETYSLYEHYSDDDTDEKLWCVNSSMLRYGLHKHLELCAKGAWMRSWLDDDTFSGFSDLAVGFKASFFEGWKAIPSVALRGFLYFPGSENSDFLSHDFAYQLDLIFSNHLTSWCELGYMGSVLWDENPSPTYFWGANLNFNLSDKVALTVEEHNYYYDFESEEKFQPWGSLTLTYHIHPRVELGIATDISLRHVTDSHNLALGVTWQLTKK